MSEAIGPMSVLPPSDADATIPAFDARSPSESMRQLIDSEARAIVEKAYAKALDLLGANRPALESLAAALLEHETLDEADAYAAAGVAHVSHPDNEGERGAL
jgi:cell division protease FtsH